MELTRSQKLILETEKFAGGRAAVICGSLLLHDKEETETLRKAVNELIRRNDMMRARINESYRNVTQDIEEYTEEEIEVLEFENEDALNEYGQQWAAVPFDLKGKLYDFRIVVLPDKSGVLAKLHHIISDAWTLALLATQLSAALNGEDFKTGSYEDHLQKEKDYRESKRFQADKDYFISQYENCDEPVYVSDTSGNNFAATRKTYLIDKETADGYLAYAQKRGISMFTLYTAAFAVYMNHINYNAERFFIGTTVLNRSGDAEKNTVGMFINSVPMFISLNNDGSFLENSETVQESVLSVLRHQRCNYSDVLGEIHRKYGTDEKLYDVLVNFQNAGVSIEGITIEWYSCGSQIESLQLHIADMNCDGVPEIHYDYRNDRFTEIEIERLHEHLFNILDEAVRDDSTKISEFNMLSEEEKQKVLSEFNRSEADFPEDETVYSLFEKIAAEKENETCITFDGGSCTYGEFRRKAERIDAYLRKECSEKCAVAVIADRSVEELAAIYGIIRGGNAYVPVSPEFPAQRIERMMETSGGKFVLAQRQYMDLWENSVCIEDILEGECEEIPEPALKPEDILYIIFTSGSTGEPKGAVNGCRALVNRINWMNNAYPLDEDGTIMLKTPYTFDVSVWEIFWWAMFGGRLHILPPGDHYVQKNVLKHIEEGSVTHIHFVPSVFRAFLQYLENNPGEKTKLKSLRHIILSGEPLLSSDVNRLRQFNEDGHVTIHNLYGPAECAVDVTYYDCREEESDPVPIGKPIENIQMYILDSFMRPLPPGVSGELCIAGAGVGMGYAGKPELTKELFIDNPYGPGRLYRTGDMGYWSEDGNIICIGRKDGLVKLGGQRIETAEIENTMVKISGVDEAIVLLHHSPDRLVGYYTGLSLSEKELRVGLSKQLPKYMVPSQFIHLDEIPLNASGKADRRRIMSLELPKADESGSEYVPPANEIEEELCRLFATELEEDVSRIGRFTNLIDEGGTSLNVVSLLSVPLLQDLSIEEIMREPTPAGIAEMLKGSMHVGELVQLYKPTKVSNALVLFPYAGGNSAAFAAITAEFRRLKSETQLFFVPWEADFDKVEDEISAIAGEMEVGFYSHCIGAVRAMKLLDRLNRDKRTVSFYFAAANIPPGKRFNLRKLLSEKLSDKMILNILESSGLYMGDATEEDISNMIEASRVNAEEYHAYFGQKTEPADVELTVILSKSDTFTRNYRDAERNWGYYVTEVKKPVYLNSRSHYFQNTNAGQVTDLLLERLHFFEQ